MAKDCPKCSLVNADHAQRCDCGYDFQKGRMVKQPSSAKDAGKAEKPSASEEQLEHIIASYGESAGAAGKQRERGRIAPLPPELYSEGNLRVEVVDVRMGFWSMVVFMVKWAIAAIPAAIILSLLGLCMMWLLAKT